MALTWASNDEATLNGIRVDFIRSSYTEHVTKEDSNVVLKPKTWFDQYLELFSDINGEVFNFVEFGIFEGGSTLLFAEYFRRCRVLAFDLRHENPAVPRHLEKMGFDDRVRLHYRIGQSDGAKIVPHVEDYFGKESLHLVIDDASHHYELSREYVEILFPRLASGGKYVIEDWAWAHWPMTTYDTWAGTTLSSLILELVMVVASNPRIFSRIEVRPGIAIITKGEATLPARMKLDTYIKTAPRVWQPLHLPA